MATHSTPVFLPGESHGQRSLVGYSPRGCKELYKTEHEHEGLASDRQSPAQISQAL